MGIFCSQQFRGIFVSEPHNPHRAQCESESLASQKSLSKHFFPETKTFSVKVKNWALCFKGFFSGIKVAIFSRPRWDYFVQSCSHFHSRLQTHLKAFVGFHPESPLPFVKISDHLLKSHFRVELSQDVTPHIVISSAHLSNLFHVLFWYIRCLSMEWW